MDPRFESCFRDWQAQQEADLEALLQALPPPPSSSSSSLAPAPVNDDNELRALIARVMNHFEEYSAHRRGLLPDDPPAFFCPAWCSTFENSFMWMGGCRPTLSVRLVYSQSGLQLNAHLDEFLAAGGAGAQFTGMVGLSPVQMDRIDALHKRTVREEERLGSRLATIQEDVADGPMLPVVMDSGPGGPRREDGCSNGDGDRDRRKVRGMMEEYGTKLRRLIEDADELRMKTVRELVVEILTPRQAVEMLAAGKKLHLAIHAWGLNRDREKKAAAGLLALL